MMNFYAKSNPKETIEEHTNRLLELLVKFPYKNYFTTEELEIIELACKYHDYGKVNSLFQSKILNDKKIIRNDIEIPHGILSCAFINRDEVTKKYPNYWSYLYKAIFYHHSNAHKFVNNKYEEYCNKYLIDNAKTFTPDIIIDPDQCSLGMIKGNMDDKDYIPYAIIKGMLNKIDYAASAYQDEIEIIREDSKENIISYFKNKNFELNECQRYMENNSDKSIIVIASTGYGKTEASLLWSKNEKTYYTLPLKVSINAIYRRLINNSYIDKNKLKHLHSDTLSFLLENEEKFEDSFEYVKSINKFKYPFTICTIDQILPFTFKALSTEIIPATLKYSKLIIDEIQSYSPQILAYITYALKLLKLMNTKFCIMTATFPKFLKEKFRKEGIYEGSIEYFINENNRHFIEIVDNDFNYTQLLEKARNCKVLVICNTVGRCQEVYKDLSSYNEDININLLHSRFTKEDRMEKEKEIMEFSNDLNAKGIWISTQIVEASLDIDFDILYTEMSTADSLLQRMGRVYRKRTYDSDGANIFVHIKYNDIIYDEEIRKISIQNLHKYNKKIFSERDKLEYIDTVYSEESIINTKYFKIFESKYNAISNYPVNYFSKKEATANIRDILNISVIPEIYREKVMNLLSDLQSIIKEKNIKKIIEIEEEISKITILVPYRYLFSKNSGSIENLPNGYRIIKSIYSKEVGLEKIEVDEEENIL